MTEAAETWRVDVFRQPVDIDYERDGDEWQDRLMVLITARVGRAMFAARWFREVEPAYVEYNLKESSLRSTLRAIPGADGMYFYVTGRGANTPDQVDPWVEAVLQAQRETGSSQTEFGWWAIVGPKPGGTEVRRTKTIASETVLGELRLTPSGTRLVEGVSGVQPTFDFSHLDASEPVVVQGKSSAYDWRRGSRQAFEQLHRLCSVLSLAMDECWVVRHYPWPEGTRLQPEVPSRINVPEDVPTDGYARHAVIPVELPAWVASGLERASRERRLQIRLAAFHEAMSAQARHPSLAAIAFVAVIESIGTESVRQERCEKCHSRIGAGKAFKHALRLVLSEEEALFLDATYDTRSKTAHEGQLYGGEVLFGMSVDTSFWTTDPATSFQWKQLWRLRDVARRLLERDLRGDT